MRLPFIVAFSLLGSTALADAPDECIAAVQANQNLNARLIALSLIEIPRKVPDGEAKRIIECLSQASGGKYEYDASIGVFFTSDQAADRAIRGARKDEADLKRKAEEAETAATAARTEKFLVDVAQSQADSRAEVIDRLSAACTRQYHRDPDAAILNKLCFDVFMQDGLPD